MAEFPAFPIWTDAYLGDTTHLTTIEHGAYLLLLMAMWRQGGSLPDDDKLLARYAKLTPGQWSRMAPTIRAFFKVSSDRITQGRLTDEYNAVRQHSAKQSNNAKSRWLKDKDSTDAKPKNGMASGNAPLPLPLPTSSSLRSEEEKEIGGGSSASAGANPEIQDPPTFRERLLDAMAVDRSGMVGPSGKRIGTQADMVQVAAWITDLGLTEAEILGTVSEVMANKRDGPPKAFRYFNDAMARLAAAKAAPPIEIPMIPPPQPKGRQNERAAFDRAINQLADGLSAGTVHLDDSSRNPFAGIGRRDAETG